MSMIKQPTLRQICDDAFLREIANDGSASALHRDGQSIILEFMESHAGLNGHRPVPKRSRVDRMMVDCGTPDEAKAWAKTLMPHLDENKKSLKLDEVCTELRAIRQLAIDPDLHRARFLDRNGGQKNIIQLSFRTEPGVPTRNTTIGFADEKMASHAIKILRDGIQKTKTINTAIAMNSCTFAVNLG